MRGFPLLLFAWIFLFNVPVPAICQSKLTIETGRTQNGSFVLAGRDSWQQLLITAKSATGGATDVTRSARYFAKPPGIVTIDDTGLVTPIKEGDAVIEAKAPAGERATVKVRVTHQVQDLPIHFANQIVPLFTKFGCNAGGCHGKSGGQNHFQLSLLGFEPAEDYEYLVKEARGRRLFPAAPESSLLLTKATGQSAHGGGARLPVDSPYYRLLKRWIAQGMPIGQSGASEVTKIEVLPPERVLAREGQQQLIVLAHTNDGSVVDVTRMAQFESRDTDLGEVSGTGLVTAKKLTGSVGVMARFQTHVSVFRGLIPLGQPVAQLPPAKNFIDEIVQKRWQMLGLPPSELASDAVFLRRVTLDLAGRIPTLAETKEFLGNNDPDRHAKWVERLLASEDYAYYFANKWGAVLRNRRKSDKEDSKPTFNFHAWIKDSLHQNKPFDVFVREILTVEGTADKTPQAIWYRDVSKINDQVEDIAQLFLGQRIMCARCHHHPFEKWTQDDYYSLAAFFSRVEIKDLPAPKKAKDEKVAKPKPPFEVVFKAGLAEAQNPRTKSNVRPAGLGAEPLTIKADDDPRRYLVDWMAGPQNPYFARTLVNRYWKHFLGKGLVEPEDDLRVTNPPTNPELLDALAKAFVDSKYDLKQLCRQICTSSAYRLSAEPNAYNAEDKQNYSRFLPRRLQAEVLHDAIDDVLFAKTNFKGVPAGTRAVRLPDNQVDSYFLSIFGRPDSASACECERSGETNLACSLHLINNPELANKISKGRAAAMVRDPRPAAEKIRELFVHAYCREPKEAEQSVMLAYLEKNAATIQNAYEDLLWAVVNSKEFLFSH